MLWGSIISDYRFISAAIRDCPERIYEILQKDFKKLNLEEQIGTAEKQKVDVSKKYNDKEIER